MRSQTALKIAFAIRAPISPAMIANGL